MIFNLGILFRSISMHNRDVIVYTCSNVLVISGWASFGQFAVYTFFCNYIPASRPTSQEKKSACGLIELVILVLDRKIIVVDFLSLNC